MGFALQIQRVVVISGITAWTAHFLYFRVERVPKPTVLGMASVSSRILLRSGGRAPNIGLTCGLMTRAQGIFLDKIPVSVFRTTSGARWDYLLIHLRASKMHLRDEGEYGHRACLIILWHPQTRELCAK